MKKLILFTIIGAFLITTGCRTRDVFLGALGVGLGLGLIKYLNDHNDGNRHHRGHHRHHRGLYDIDLQEMATNADAQKFANKHHISYDAAKKIQNAFVNVSSKGLDSFTTIGLRKGDLKDFMKHDLPSSNSIKNMADKLDMSEAQARDLLLSMNKDFEDQASNVNSTYWKGCTQDREWKTPQNASCTSLSARGCSPATGASMCF